jgi:cobalt-zinc-cadmium efflux system protein
MEHSHNHHHHPGNSWDKRLMGTMVLNLIIPAVQIYGGIVSGSMALISDALHNLSDFTSVAISYTALRLGRHKPTMQQTFGYKRVEVFAALLNVALLYGVGFFIALENWQRIHHPRPIDGHIVIIMAAFAFLANMLSTLMLRSGAKENMNIRSAFLHMLTDTLMSLIVAILGIVWLYKPWYWLDPVASWLIVALIIYGGWGILKRTLLILMNATPEHIDIEDIRRSVEGIDGVEEIHHLHVWNVSAESVALAAHVIVPDQMLSSIDSLSETIRRLLHEKFRIDHPILQFETRRHDDTSLLCRMEAGGTMDCR